MGISLVGGLAEQFAGEDEPGADFSRLEVVGQLIPGEGCVGLYGDGKSEPARLRMSACLGEDEELLQRFQCGLPVGEVLFASRDELRQLCDLGYAEGCLHVGGLEVVAYRRVGVFVIVTAGQRAQWPVEALAAGVVLAGFAPAVTAPVSEAVDEDLQGRSVSEDRAAFAHGDVVRGVEADGCNVAEGAYLLAPVGGSEGVAAVLDQPQVVLFAEGRNRIEIEDVAQGVGD